MAIMTLKSFLLVASCALVACSEQAPTQTTSTVAGCDTRAFAEIGGAIDLIDAATEQPVTEEDFKGQQSLVYFGFTYCPDICPAALVTIDRALKRLPEGSAVPRTIMISIDPERDTPEALSSYISTGAFPDDIVGLTGPEESVKTAAAGFKTGFSRVEDPDSLAEYTMDHTSIIYLMDEDWKLKTFFTHEVTAEQMGDCLATHIG